MQKKLRLILKPFQGWLLGEYAARIPDWGSQSIPTDYLHKQTAMLRAWQTLELPL